MANRIQLRRGSATQWSNSNPTLAQGELGIELDTGRIKIGDGVTAWNSLRYERPIESVSATANTLVQRDADGNFAAGTVTATLIGNASTSDRLSSTRQVSLTGDLTGSNTFDGGANLPINAELSRITTLPHYSSENTEATGTYTKVVVDSKGRITNASNPTTIQDYGLDTSIAGTGAQPYDLDLAAITNLTDGAAGFGLISRTSTGNITVRDIVTASTQRIVVNNGDGINGNPEIDLGLTTVVPDTSSFSQGLYNTESLTSVNSVGANGELLGTETVNTIKFTVDKYGRLQSATNVPIATATEGSKYANYDAGTAYSRYAIIQNASKVYQAIADIGAGVGAPTHSSGDTGSWRYLAAEATEQKGLASFAQEDFDVDSNGHVTIAAVGVDNTQLQNNRISFADGTTKEDFELDQELTATSGYRGFNYLNYIKVNDVSGNLLVGANNTGDSGAGELDVNVRSYFSDADITLDGALNQTLDKTGDGNLTFQLSQNTATDRNFNILTTNAGSGSSNIIITAEDLVEINASEGSGKVTVENARFQANYIATGNATMNLDPGDDRAVTGTVRVWGDLQVDGTTTTVNSTTLQVDDPIITLGGDTAPATDDNLDRGIEFRYYDTEARLGFYGWDTNYTDLGGHGGGYRFLHAATNTTEVFTGTDSGIIAGNVKLTTGTNSTTNTTGDLVVAGGVGITQDVNIGGLLDVDSTFRANSTSRFDDTMVLRGASKSLQFQNGAGTVKSEIHTTTGNAEFGGILTVTGATDLNSTLNVASSVHFEATDEPTFALNSGTGIWEIQSNDYGSFRFDGGGYIAGDFMFDSDVVINGTILQKESATEVFNEQNFLRVRRKLESGSVQVLTPSYASHTTSNARIFGGAGIGTSLHIGGTSASEGLFIGKKESADTVKFSVLGASGNTDIEGTLNVEGEVTIQDSVIINAANEVFSIRNGSGVAKFDVDTDNGNTLIEGTLNVNGTVDVDADFAVRNGTTDKFFVDNVTGNTVIEGTLNGKGDADFDSDLNVDGNTTLVGTLTVTNTTEFNNTVDVDANFAVRSGSTDKMTVASSSGNIATDGTLVVQGQTTINDSLIVDASNELFSVRNGSAVAKFEVDTDNGNTNIIGTLTVGDATQINDTLGVSNVVTFTRNTQQTLTGSYAADGAFRLTGGAAIGKNLAVGGAARIYGGTELTGALDLNSSADISGALVTHDNVTITANNKTFAIQNGSAANKLTVDTDNGNTDIRGTLDIGGDVTAESNLTVTGNLTINGTTTTVNSTVTTLDDPIITVGGDTAPASNDGKDRGVEFRYYDSSAKIGFFGYDRSANQFAFVTDATNSSEVLSGTDGPLRAGSLNLTGAGTSLDVDANANIDGTLTVDGQIISQVSSGPALVIPNTTKINNLNADLLDSMTTASAATATTVVARDSSGDFAANIITVASGEGAAAGIQGNSLTADTLKRSRIITLDGVVDGSVSFNGSADVTISTTYNDADITALAAMAGTGLVARTAANTYAQRSVTATASSGITVTNADGVSGNITINVASASTNAANNLVLRDASGDFAANEITADLIGGVTGNVTGNLTGNVTGNSSTVSTSSSGSATEVFVGTVFNQSGTNSITTNPGFKYDRATAKILGNLQGDVTGNLTGSASQVDTVTASSANAAYHLTMVDQHNTVANNETINTDQSLTYNPSTNRLKTKLELQTDAAPASATATGTVGEIRYDTNYIYICVATDTWKRAAISTWS
ncbi:structural protein [Synechococcus phage ACG-2014b]|uniref:Structural protein n=2 Tax=Synechococcus phage ACG-2014b TaxID=1493508 RepID=A0A0E3F8U7_9CAUD|nr:structural protein [Synechococcus phage ACG-2014b]YP_009779719.1 structural protein [Synechococcus phage ACG-2014b]AIX17313.1 structural protein [Synechococcus phage ACG-2014b]AIX17961.1 structural protein [Synechococcus phage ACG-2014b]AIX18176.1 structural protein [Synechococcus phage ACG-2014b]AIX19334.1 structural protein [Synechococcus phage ACG-2014b]AIX19768.1 structural protein [Synechococcus phage ACG-2014b]